MISSRGKQKYKTATVKVMNRETKEDKQKKMFCMFVP